MKKLRAVYCAECEQRSFMSDDNDSIDAKYLWEKILKETPDEKGDRTVVIDTGIPFYKDAPIVGNADKNNNLLKEYKDALDGPYGVTGRNYLGLPIQLRMRCIKLSNNRFQGVLYGILSRYDYEVYGNCKIIDSYERHCPVCGKKTEFLSSEFFWDASDYFLKKANEYVLSIKKKCTSKNTSGKGFDYSKSENIDIKTYLRHLIDVSTNIIFLENQIKDSYCSRSGFKRDVFATFLKKQNDPEIRKKEKEYQEPVIKALEEKKEELNALTEYSQNQIRELCIANGLEWLETPKQPQEPVKPEIPLYCSIDSSKLIEPTPPEIKKASFFNKKRIEAENQWAQKIYEKELREYKAEKAKELKNNEKKTEYEQLLQEYNAKKAQYDEAIKQYQEDVEVYNSRYPEFEKRRSEIIEKDKQRIINEKAPKIQAEIKKLEKKLNEIQSEIETGEYLDFYLISSDTNYRDERFKTVFYDNEIKEFSTELAKQYNILNKLLEPKIIFPKYNDIVAWSSFYEYLVTGRAESLSGINGAYNLYERELRANIIIAKMDVIIEKLDQIKDNQYTLYSLIEKTNDEVRELSKRMDSLLSCEEELTEISKDSRQYLENLYKTNQGIAFNTKKIAKFSEIEANATKAIAFMKLVWG